MKLRMNRRVSTGLALVATLGACSAGGGEEEGTEEAVERIAGVDRVELGAEALADLQLTFETAQIRELVPSLEVPAEIVADPDRVAIIGSRVSGRIVEVMHNVGDAVPAGAPLVVIELGGFGTNGHAPSTRIVVPRSGRPMQVST